MAITMKYLPILNVVVHIYYGLEFIRINGFIFDLST